MFFYCTCHHIEVFKTHINNGALFQMFLKPNSHITKNLHFFRTRMSDIFPPQNPATNLSPVRLFASEVDLLHDQLTVIDKAEQDRVPSPIICVAYKLSVCASFSNFRYIISL